MNATGFTISFADTMIETVEDFWKLIPKAIESGGTIDYKSNESGLEFNFSLNVSNFVNSPIYNIFRNFAYSLVLVFFAASLIENSIMFFLIQC